MSTALFRPKPCPLSGDGGATMSSTERTHSRRGSKNLSQNEENWLEGAFSAPKKVTRPDIDLSEGDRTERFLEWLDGEARWVWQYKKWFMWDNDRWTQDEAGGQIVQKGLEFLRFRTQECNEIAEPKLRQKAWTIAKQAENGACIRSMVSLAQTYPSICTSITDFDADPWVFAFKNGVLILKTKEFRANRKEDLIFKRSPVVYDPSATCPIWLKYLERVVPDQGTRDFLQRACGYSMTGLTQEQLLFFLYGTGKNGKSTFMNTMQSIMGDYAWRTSAQLFIEGKGDANEANLKASLPEMRMVFGAEIGDRALNERLIKDLTGGDMINARKLYCEAFQFQPTHKLWFYGNERPTIYSCDEGIWRRMCLIPFTVWIPDEERIRDMDKTVLVKEWPGIVNWMVEGCRLWQAEGGLTKSKAIHDATEEYRSTEDLMGEFFEMHCKFGPEEYIDCGGLYSVYTDWATGRGVATSRLMGEKKVASRVMHAGAKKTRIEVKGRKITVWKGLSLIDRPSWVKAEILACS